MRDRIVFYLNGVRREIASHQAHLAQMMLADYLRYELSLTGTKIVCAEGDCGACTVLRSFPLSQGTKGKPNFLPVNSCVVTVAQMDGSSLITVDALKSSTPESSLSPVQKAMLECHGSQCGFCTPGFVMALSGLVEKKCESKSLEPQEIKNALTGNLCRCTGYQPIIDAASTLNPSKCGSLSERFYSASQDRELRAALGRSVYLENEEFSFFAPTTLKEAAQYLKKNPDTRIIAGGSDLGVVHNKRKLRLTKLISLHAIPELYRIKKKGALFSVGARVSLSELRNAVKSSVPEFARFLDIFASPQIKNVATLVGNVGNASPIADTPPFLLVSGAVLTLVGPSGKRQVPIEKFYQGYRKTSLKAGEAIAEIGFEAPSKSEKLVLYKVSQRKDLDISTVNAAFRVKWKPGSKRGSKGRQIDTIRIAYGGVAAIPLRLFQTEKTLQGTELSNASIQRAIASIHEEMQPISDLRGTSAYRRVLVENLFQRFMSEENA